MTEEIPLTKEEWRTIRNALSSLTPFALRGAGETDGRAVEPRSLEFVRQALWQHLINMYPNGLGRGDRSDTLLLLTKLTVEPEGEPS